MFDYEIRRFSSDGIDPRVSKDLADLHRTLLAHSPLVLMGSAFMEKFYYRVLPANDLIFGAVAYVDDRAAGFVVATGDPEGFMDQAVRRFWFRLCWILIKTVVQNPFRLRAMLEAYRIQSSVKSEGYGPTTGEVLSLGVLPEFRPRERTNDVAIHVSSDLMRTAIEQLRSKGKTRIRAIVDKDNLEAQLFYRSSGWRVGLKTVKGWRIPTMEFLLDID